MAFNGLVVGDWNGHGQVPGCTNTSCAASINAGVDIFMAPDSWKGLYESTLAQVRSGEILAARLDDAVRRILRVKLRAHSLKRARRRHVRLRANSICSVRRSIVRSRVGPSVNPGPVKNQGRLLPLSAKANVLVAGDGADNIGKQSGGWTITWQGTDLTNKDFPNGQSIFGGIKETVAAAGGTATLSVDGKYRRSQM